VTVGKVIKAGEGLMDLIDSLVKRYQVNPKEAEDIVKNNRWMNLQGAIADEPTNTTKAYKMFDQRDDGRLYPLFVDADAPIPMNEWMFAKHIKPNDKGAIDSKLGSLSYRPGFHSGTNPFATHIGGKTSRGNPDYRKYNQVWGEIEIPNDYDWYNEAMMRSRLTNAGDIDLKTAEIKDQLPIGGSYRYNTNPNVAGDWMISDRIKVNRLLERDEIKDINKQSGVADLPFLDELIKQGKVDPKKLGPTAIKQLKGAGLLDLIKYK
jgi:hypothetical protein